MGPGYKIHTILEFKGIPGVIPPSGISLTEL